jgi:alpha-D-xyloside xylohydrolase
VPSSSLSGPAFWSHDIGGFTGTANATLYKRWVAFGLLSTHSRLHGSDSYRVPWLLDEESVTVMRHFAKLKNRLFPYIFAAAREANERGTPVMRAMMLEYPDDPACAHLDRQYMLGPALLVAPVFRQDNVAEYYLPKGRWTDLESGKLIEGGRWRKETLDFMHMPLFARENSIVPMSADEQQPRWALSDELILNLFQIAGGADLMLSVPASDSDEITSFSCRRSGERIVLCNDGRAKRVKIVLRSVDSIGKVINGKVLAQVAEGLLLEWSDTNKPITIQGSEHPIAPKLEKLLSAARLTPERTHRSPNA